VTAEIQSVPLERLYPHPDNPRLQLREDVVQQLAAEIGRVGFRPEHAVLVRPFGDGWQLVSGHHRAEAARRAGLIEVPAWVRDMDDDEAFMQLVLSNTQGELSPLEIGMHALTWSGEQKSYAERTGFGKSYVSQLRSGAEVAAVYSSKLSDLADKAKHLYEISKAPREVWPVLVDALVKHGWSVADTAKQVARVREFEIGDEYADWLPIADVVARHLEAPERFTPRGVVRLVAAAGEVEAWIEANAPERLHEFLEWLTANRGGESWDHRAIVAYHQRLIASRYEVQGWHHGNWREYVDELQDGTVSLILTDPPYGMGYQSGYRYQSGTHEPIAADASIEDASVETAAALEALAPKLAPDAHVLVFCTWRNEYEVRDLLRRAGFTIRGSLIWAKNNTSMGDLDGSFAPAHERIVHAVKGKPKLYRRAPDVLECPRESTDRHPTEKPVKLLAELIEATTTTGQVVADPFGGVGSTCVAAKESGRKWWGCELEEKYWAVGEERLLS